MFTRQHYAKVAHTLNANVAPLYLVQDFADMFEEDNPRFDRAAFVQDATEELVGKQNHEDRMLAAARRGNG